MTLHHHIIALAAILVLSVSEINNFSASNKTTDFVNTIVDGECNTFGYDKYVRNADAATAYTVTVKVVSFKAGDGTREFQKIVSVPAGGKTYVGCSVSAETGGPSYTYTVIGENRQ